jgi:hypothetical protein
MRWSHSLSLLIVIVLASGCLPLPAPSITRTDSKLVEQPRAEGDTILIFGRNAERPLRGRILSTSGDGLFALFVAGCRDVAYHQDTISRVGESVYEANRAILGPKGLADEMGRLVLPEGSEWKPPAAFAQELSQAHVRYLVVVDEDVDTTVHLPLWMPMFGVAACAHKTTLEARVWELPSGRFVGSISTSARGEYVVLSYVVNLFFIPDTQGRATAKLVDELVQKLADDSASRIAAAQVD